MNSNVFISINSIPHTPKKKKIKNCTPQKCFMYSFLTSLVLQFKNYLSKGTSHLLILLSHLKPSQVRLTFHCQWDHTQPKWSPLVHIMRILLFKCACDKRSWTCIKNSHQWMILLQCHDQLVASFPLPPLLPLTTFSSVVAPHLLSAAVSMRIVKWSLGDHFRSSSVFFFYRERMVYGLCVSWMTCFITD